MELNVGVPAGFDESAQSDCCASPVEHYRALSGVEFHRCARCRKATNAVGQRDPESRRDSPANDVETAFAAILRALDWFAPGPHPTEAQAAARERQAFYFGARLAQVTTGITGDGWIRDEAERRYPTMLHAIGTKS